MKQLRHKRKFLIFVLGGFLFLPKAILAVCPVCSMAIGGGVGLSRYLGIDDVISGIWIGGFLLSLVLWCLDWLKKRKINFLFKKPLVSFAFYFSSFYFIKNYFHPCNQLWGINKLFLGIIFGSLGFGMGVNLDYLLRKRNKGKVYFPFQKVILPVFVLIILSVVFYFITKC